MTRPRPIRGGKTTVKSARPTVVCFGEVLWDCLPKGLFLGGAPINAAYHLARYGLTVLPVTAVGRDFLGDEALRRVASWGLDTKFVGRDSAHPTGVVTATLDAAGAATRHLIQANPIFPLDNPAILSVPLGFLAAVLGTLVSREPEAEAAYSELNVRANTGIGAV